MILEAQDPIDFKVTAISNRFFIFHGFSGKLNTDKYQNTLIVFYLQYKIN